MVCAQKTLCVPHVHVCTAATCTVAIMDGGATTT